MYICICNAVTDRQILEAAAEGAGSLNELMQKTGCGSCCGCCQDEVETLLHQARQPKLSSPSIPIMAG